MRPNCLLIGVFGCLLLCQQAGFAAKQQRMAGPPPFARVRSPEFNADSTITFRIWAPKASEVRLECARLLGTHSNQMERFDKEYWHNEYAQLLFQDE